MTNIVDWPINMWIGNKQLELAMWSSLMSLDLGKNGKTEMVKQSKYFCEFFDKGVQELQP